MDPSVTQVKFFKSAVKNELVDHTSIVSDSYKRQPSDDSCSRDWSPMFTLRHPHTSYTEVDRYRTKEERSADTRLGLPVPEIRVNQIGQPYGHYETMVIDQLRSIVRKYVPVTTMWASVSKEVRYRIVRELQSRFTDGGKLDSSWIKMKAGKLLASDRGKAKTILWQKHSSLFETCI